MMTVGTTNKTGVSLMIKLISDSPGSISLFINNTLLFRHTPEDPAVFLGAGKEKIRIAVRIMHVTKYMSRSPR